jgi:23S rRNA (cytidine1920-2'-O)/16S rRNA (cytidine1409-2'-O)-methyltransferase
MARARADLVIVARGLADTRAKAQAAIEAGGVTADGAPVIRAAQLIDEAAEIALVPPHPWVSRAGVKLAFALETFAISPAGLHCLDIGASTGGFTQVLLAGGARHIVAVDVGHAQMHATLRADARVTLREGCDARRLTAEMVGEAPALIVCDASFIGLEKILPTPLSLAAPAAALIALVKPQFESGPRRGALLSPAAAFQIAEAVAHRLDGLGGFAVRALVDSPIAGGDGAPEFLLHAARS